MGFLIILILLFVVFVIFPIALVYTLLKYILPIVLIWGGVSLLLVYLSEKDEIIALIFVIIGVILTIGYCSSLRFC